MGFFGTGAYSGKNTAGGFKGGEGPFIVALGLALLTPLFGWPGLLAGATVVAAAIVALVYQERLGQSLRWRRRAWLTALLFPVAFTVAFVTSHAAIRAAQPQWDVVLGDVAQQHAQWKRAAMVREGRVPPSFDITPAMITQAKEDPVTIRRARLQLDGQPETAFRIAGIVALLLATGLARLCHVLWTRRAD